MSDQGLDPFGINAVYHTWFDLIVISFFLHNEILLSVEDMK